MIDLVQIGENAKTAAISLALIDNEQRNNALCACADALIKNSAYILNCNKLDIVACEQNGASAAFIDRLTLTESRLDDMACGLRNVAGLPDCVGQTIDSFTHRNGMTIKKVCVAIGVVAVIFESRPNVAADSAAICLKSGNAVILKGGSEAINSCKAIVSVLRNTLKNCGIDENSVCLIEDTNRESTKALMQMKDYVDLLIPRGGKNLINSVVSNATVPVIETGAGTCHTYIDKDADIDMACEIVFNAKTSRPSVCNALECLLVHKDIASSSLPKIAEKLKEKNVEIRADKTAKAILGELAFDAEQSDWGNEYNDYIIAVKVVNDIDEALAHIAKYSTKHSECIVTDNIASAKKFLSLVDAAAVYHNVSTRFTDGGEFGLGAEIGISTQKLHARGPLGPKELTTYKYIITGCGQIRS